MDEPTSKLDATTRDEVWNTIQKVKKEKTVVIVSHDSFEILNADNVAVVEGGRLTELGTPTELLENNPDSYLKSVRQRAEAAISTKDDAIDLKKRLENFCVSIDETKNKKEMSIDNEKAMTLSLTINGKGRG